MNKTIQCSQIDQISGDIDLRGKEFYKKEFPIAQELFGKY